MSLPSGLRLSGQGPTDGARSGSITSTPSEPYVLCPTSTLLYSLGPPVNSSLPRPFSPLVLPFGPLHPESLLPLKTKSGFLLVHVGTWGPGHSNQLPSGPRDESVPDPDHEDDPGGVSSSSRPRHLRPRLHKTGISCRSERSPSHIGNSTSDTTSYLSLPFSKSHCTPLPGVDLPFGKDLPSWSDR